MRRLLAAALFAAAVAQSAHGQTVACDVRLNVIDQDPAGLNVRASPGGAVIGALRAKGRWVQVHVTGQSDKWAHIDDAADVDEDTAASKPLHPASGWVAFSKLGFEEFNSATHIQAAPSEDAKTLLSIEGSGEAKAPPMGIVLGCSGAFVKVRIKGITGWTSNFCSSRLTTCV